MNTALDYNDYLYFEFDDSIPPVFIRRGDQFNLIGIHKLVSMARLIASMKTGKIVKDRNRVRVGRNLYSGTLLDMRISFNSDDVLESNGYDEFIDLYFTPQTLSDNTSESESYNFRCGMV